MNELERQLRIIKSRTEEIVPEEELREKLKNSLNSGKPLKVKFGIDPTGSELHVGHAVPLRKIKQFQELGHSIEFIIGSFTAKIGDPTGKNETRKMMSNEDIERNCKTYLDQASKIIDIDKINLHYNGDWLSKLNFEDLLQIMANFSLSLMISREDFAKRLKNNIPISLVELSYPMMQAYDSVHLKSDIEIGGTDQKFNLLRGRDLQRAFGQSPQVCLTLPILEGTSGKDKMSKSLNNYISIKEGNRDMYGKVMSIKDVLIETYYNLVTELDDELLKEISKKMKDREISPYEAKKRLAKEITLLYHNRELADDAENHFDTIFSKREIPEDVEEKEIRGRDIVSLVSEEAKVSKSQARRLIASGAIKIDGITVNELKPGIIKIGKKIIFKIK